MAVQQLAAVVYIPDSPLAAVRRDRCEGCGPALAGKSNSWQLWHIPYSPLEAVRRGRWLSNSWHMLYIQIPDSPLAAVRRDRCEGCGCGPALAGSPTAGSCGIYLIVL